MRVTVIHGRTNSLQYRTITYLQFHFYVSDKFIKLIILYIEYFNDKLILTPSSAFQHICDSVVLS